MIPSNEYVKIVENMPIVCIDGIIINSDGKFLLVKRENEPFKGEYWVPGGRLLKNETLENAVKRKMKQELGIEVKIQKLFGYFEDFYENTYNVQSGLHVVSFIFLLNTDEIENIKLDNQSSEWKWFNELPSRLLDKLKINGDNDL